MRKIAKYLKDNYYTKYAGCPSHLIPEEEDLVRALDIHKDKIVVVLDGEQIRGVAVFLTLSDETFANIESIDVGNMEILRVLLQETGSNIHFILLTADSYETIKDGVKAVKALHPKTISWWNPTNTQLHKYKLN